MYKGKRKIHPKKEKKQVKNIDEKKNNKGQRKEEREVDRKKDNKWMEDGTKRGGQKKRQ
jgi:hypothetical protein